MKKIIYLNLLLLLTVSLEAQIAIGKDEVSSTSASLEFADTDPRGLILPYVTNKSGITENGTFIFDATDFRVKFLSNGTWLDLNNSSDGQADLSIQGNDKTNLPNRTIYLGSNAENDGSRGIVVLTDKDKAMVLPKVASPHLNIVNPAPGMIVYDTDARQLAVFNGTTWAFWKP